MKIYKYISLYFNTIKFLRFSQIIYRFLLIVPKNYSFSRKRPLPKIRFSNAPLVRSVKYSRTIIAKNTFIFLNKKMYDCSSNLWNNNNLPKLWLYNLHYFNDLRLLDDSYTDNNIKETLAEWINDNPFGYGVGWEPYPLSIRIVNIIKWLSNKKADIDSSLIKSLVMQVRYLEKNLEYHLKGNHLFSNAKALIFAGYFFEGEEASLWLKRGMKILESETREQILDDGGHYERSTMYHALALEDFLDLKNIILSNNKIFKEHKSFVTDIDNIIDRMIIWLKTMTHPDGNISFFNDAAFNIAASTKDLLSYATRLNYESSDDLKEVTYLKNTGYIRVNVGNMSLFVDVAPLGPDYLLAHAHADSLSYEFSYKNQRIVVNSGTSLYKNGNKRDFERGTASHSTLEIESENSSEVWHSFRVAKRARVFDISITNQNKNIEISAKHDGYMRLKRGAIHSRKWIVNKKSLEIIDSIDGRFSKAVSRHYIHPDISISDSNKDRVITLNKSDSIFWDTKSDLVNLKSSEWYPEFGIAIKNKCLNININPDTKNTECNIRFTLN